MWNDYNFFVLVAILVALVADLILTVIDFQAGSQIADEFDLEAIQKELIDKVGPSPEKIEATSSGGVARSASMRMKQLDSLIGETMVQNTSPMLKALGQLIPGTDRIETWVEDNPDLASLAIPKLEAFAQSLLGNIGVPQGGTPTQNVGNTRNRGGFG